MRILKTADQVKRLPRWAQTHIEFLEDRARGLQRQIDQMTGDVNTSVSFSVMLDPPHPIPSNANVRFLMGDDRIECKLQNRAEQVILVVSSGSGQIVIEPKASNRIVLTTKQD